MIYINRKQFFILLTMLIQKKKSCCYTKHSVVKYTFCIAASHYWCVSHQCHLLNQKLCTRYVSHTTMRWVSSEMQKKILYIDTLLVLCFVVVRVLRCSSTHTTRDRTADVLTKIYCVFFCCSSDLTCAIFDGAVVVRRYHRLIFNGKIM